MTIGCARVNVAMCGLWKCDFFTRPLARASRCAECCEMRRAFWASLEHGWINDFLQMFETLFPTIFQADPRRGWMPARGGRVTVTVKRRTQISWDGSRVTAGMGNKSET
eukprot:s1030_g8.t1